MPGTIAVDLGGTKLAVAHVVDGKIGFRLEQPTAAPLGPAAVTGQIVRMVEEARQRGAGDVARLGVAATGRVHGGRVTALNLETMPGWTDVPLHDDLQRLTHLPTTLVNDADAAALAEARLGAGQGAAAMMFVTVSTGVGAGIVLNGELLQSASGIHADFGYLRTETGETVEEVCGGRALERWNVSHGGQGGARQLIGRAQSEPQAAARLDQAALALVRGFGAVRVLTGIENVVIGGSVGLNPLFLDRLRHRAQAEKILYRVNIHAAALGADAGLYGAALFASPSEGRGD